MGAALLPAETLARTLIVRPESATIVYSSKTFSVRETLFVPVHEPGAIIALDIDTTGPLEIEAVFDRDLQLEWPASLGDTGGEWDPKLRVSYIIADREFKRPIRMLRHACGGKWIDSLPDNRLVNLSRYANDHAPQGRLVGGQ